MPLPLGILIITLGLWLLYQNKTKAGRRVVLFGLGWLFLLSYDPFANLLLYPIEHRYPALLQAPKDTRYIYVLGYGHNTDKKLSLTSQIDPEAVVRLTEGIRLYRALEGKAKLIVSGYSGISDPTPHAVMQQKLAIALGIPKSALILVPTATDTEDEAKAAEKITHSKPMILVSSAYHLPRAIGWFQKEGLHPYPAPTYHLSSLTHPHYFEIFSANALKKSTIAFHEYFGMLWQKIKGV